MSARVPTRGSSRWSGTLAAFGALGRIAFAAVPNVKPTTVIVLISGYALGGAPGYVVGAVAALTSNFFFGQGPWTPWQMAGWGATGIAGALLARLTRGRIGRLPLALACFVLGFAFTALQDVGDWVSYSDHSLAQLGIYVGKGVGFDLVYAASCFGFAMLFGPALIRTLTRFRTRIQVTWLPAGRTCRPCHSCWWRSCWPARSPDRRRRLRACGTDRPSGTCEAAQNRDGGWGSAGGQQSNHDVHRLGGARAGRRASSRRRACGGTAATASSIWATPSVRTPTPARSSGRSSRSSRSGVDPVHFSHVNLSRGSTDSCVVTARSRTSPI